VRKSGNQVRIVAQLIDVSTDEHIWSETYDRELTEVFAIQSEVAMEIAKVLKAQLTTSEKQNIAKKATINITAYDYYLKARPQQFLNAWMGGGTLVESQLNNSLVLLDEALNLDPDFALAYVHKGRLLYLKRFLGVPRSLWLDSALSLADRAIALDPEEPEAYVLRYRIFFYGLNSGEAYQDLQKAFKLDPNNPQVLQVLGNYRILNGEFDEGAAMILKSIDLEFSRTDPEFYIRWGGVYMNIGEFDRAELYFKQAQKLSPDGVAPLRNFATLYNLRGKRELAIEYNELALEKMKGENPPPSVYDNLAWHHFVLGNLEEAAQYWIKFREAEDNLEDSAAYLPARHRLGYVRWLQGDKKQAMKLFEEQMELDLGTIENQKSGPMGYGHFYDLAVVNAFLGNTEEAYRWLDSTIIKNRFFGLWTVENDPLLESIRGDERFQSILAEKKKQEALKDEAFRKLVREREASEQLKLRLSQ
ncbi:MAG: hypothetical protein O7F74_01810, partial [Bacteroidetes bacterium]|nr:hypothetical protein [Bacteroidota bacterium]